MQFPRDFQWGVATAAAQIEGAAFADGKGESIWDRMAKHGKVPGGMPALDAGAGHYARWAEDVGLLQALGTQVYRFSVSWPRIFPNGTGAMNPKGLDFYRRLIAALQERGIQPALTLYHWDLPQALQDRGGWLNRDTAYRFAEYAAALFGEFGTDVPQWMTLNEPFVATFWGHMTGEHAPGVRRPFSAMQAAHHMLLGHGEAVRAFRDLVAAGKSRIGITHFLWEHEPASSRPADQTAARRGDGMVNRWFTDPVLKGRYPEDIWRWYRSRLAAPSVRPGDMATIGQPIDFMGVQYYSRIVHRANPWNLLTGIAQVQPHDYPLTEMGYEVYPDGLYKLLVRLGRDYPGVALIVTENGMACRDEVGTDGRVLDTERIQYLQTHIRAVGNACKAGVNVQGYYVWSFMDNVEWVLGVDKRFGLVHVDFATMQRTVKESGWWYRDFIRGAAALPE